MAHGGGGHGGGEQGGEVEQTSAVLSRLVATFPGEQIRMGDIVAALGDRAYGLLLLIFALPSLVPIPGISTIFGIPLGIFAAQLALGMPRPWLPRRLLERPVATGDLRAVLARALPWLQRLERILRPRLPQLTSFAAERLIGLACLVLACVLALPIVFGNFLPAVAVVILALGIIERDGLAVIVGAVTGVFATIFVALVVLVGLKAILFVAERVLG